MRIALTGARAPATLELAHLLRAAGHAVDLVDSVPWTVSRWSRVLGPVWRIPSPRLSRAACVASLRALASQRRWDAILPTCEEIFHLARAVATDANALGVPLWAPATSMLEQLHHKGTFMQLAREAGLPTPETHVLSSPLGRRDERREACAGAWVLKPAWSRFGTRVHLVADGDAWPRDVHPSAAEPWVLQRWLRGAAWCTWSVVRDGQLLAHSAYQVEATAGAIGAAVAFTMRAHGGIANWVSRFAAAHRLTGQFAFDFIDTERGPLPLECNPRLTSGVHGFRGNATLGARVVQAFSCGALDDSTLTPVEGRRFTSALALRTYGHRVPRGEELLDIPGDPWPQRLQLLSYAWLMASAVRHGVDPRALSTRDIEFNGPDRDS